MVRKILLIAFLGIFALVGAAAAAQVTLQWDPKGGVDPSGYMLFERNFAAGGLYNYEVPIWPTDGLDHTETSATIEVADNLEHAFVIRAYLKKTMLDGSVQIDQSADSNEVTFTPEVQVESPKDLIIGAVQYLSKAIDNLAAAARKLQDIP